MTSALRTSFFQVTFDRLVVPVALRSPSRQIGHEDIPQESGVQQGQTRRAERHHPFSLAFPDAARRDSLLALNSAPPSASLSASRGRSQRWPCLWVDMCHNYVDCHPRADQLDALSAPSPLRMLSATPCSDWTVADLSDHIVNSPAGMSTIARGGEPDWAASTHHDDPASALQREAVRWSSRSLLVTVRSRRGWPPRSWLFTPTTWRRPWAGRPPTSSRGCGAGPRLHDVVDDRRDAGRCVRA